MKNLIKSTLMSLTIMFIAVCANAQTPYQSTGNSEANAGSTGLTVTVQKSADLRSFGNNLAENGATQSGGSKNNALDVNLTFSNITPSQTAVISTGVEKFMRAYVPIMMRSNAPYEIKAFMVGGAGIPNIESSSYGIPAGAGNSGDFRLGDIGFGIRNHERACTPGTVGCLLTANVVQQDISAQSPVFANVVNGQPLYDVNANLNYIGVGSANATRIAYGNRISVRGDNTSANWRKVQLAFAIKPQYYTPATFTDTFKVFITTP